jgi:hypothetical protein
VEVQVAPVGKQSPNGKGLSQEWGQPFRFLRVSRFEWGNERRTPGICDTRKSAWDLWGSRKSAARQFQLGNRFSWLERADDSWFVYE